MYRVRVGRAIEVEIKVPNNKHFTSREIAVIQKITKLGKKADLVSLFFFEGGGLYRQKKWTSCGEVTVS